MKLYHGSKQDVEKLTRQQASSPYTDVPEEEKQDAIYLTPDYGYAVAMGAKPSGVTIIENDIKKIEFERPEDFDPERDIYIYTVDSKDIPKHLLTEEKDENGEIDRLQFAALVPEIIPELKEKKKAREVMKYYELKNWKESQEPKIRMK